VRPSIHVRLAVALVLTVAVVALCHPHRAGAVPTRAGEHRVDYQLPVDAPVVDPFRPPPHRYGAGNRGLELGTTAGTQVGAAAPGRVAFAGSVAGRLFVTVQHADRVRTTYGPLAAIDPGARVGAAVGAGQAVGTVGDRLLWTARLGDAYLDPAVLLAASGVARVHLVPDGPAAPAATALGP
jgi:septal ring factor EnvC (AmiA/AmiB activator)